MDQLFTNKLQSKMPYQDNIIPERACKIVATIGPSSSEIKTLENLIKSGMNIARLNFSHGDHKFHEKNIEKIRNLSLEQGRNVAILQDLQGPKIRCGRLIKQRNMIEKGKQYTLFFGLKQEKEGFIPVDYRNLSHDTEINHRVLMDDGLLIFRVIAKKKDLVIIEACNDGVLKDRKGINFPDSHISQPALTEKDTRDLLFGISHGVDAVALSFVQRADDIKQCRKILSVLGSDIPIIAKIEKTSAVDQIDAIAYEADGLMVARGDLGIEGSVEKVPAFQNKIISTAEHHAIPVIIATQMLESMTNNPEPTLAEITDVANGVLDQTDCVMLSGEVAAGQYPVNCVRKMASIIDTIEAWTYKKSSRYNQAKDQIVGWEKHSSIAKAACEAADALGARYIVCLTLTGSIAHLISKWRPRTPIIAISPRHDVIKRLSFCWGVHAIRNPLFYNTDNLLEDIPQLLKKDKIVKDGDTIVITAGIPIKAMCSTNMIKINKI